MQALHRSDRSRNSFEQVRSVFRVATILQQRPLEMTTSEEDRPSYCLYRTGAVQTAVGSAVATLDSGKARTLLHFSHFGT
jgi:hypothetical protein